MHDFPRRVDEGSYGRAFRQQPLEQPHGLEKVEAKGLPLERIPDFGRRRRTGVL
jgi:hypothetical protein